MKTITENHGNGNSTKYKITESGTAYHFKTPQKVIDILERARYRETRLRIYLGDSKTGIDWVEENSVVGTIGRSTGTIKIPLLILTKRSIGGGAILDHCIVKIKDQDTKEVLYQHPKYKTPIIEIKESDLPQYEKALYVNGKLYSRHKTELSAKRLKTKLS